MAKFKGLWPLPGGARNYVLTLKEILRKVYEDHPSENELLSWLKEKYGLSGEQAPRSYLGYLERAWGLLGKDANKRFIVTQTARDFLDTGSNRVILDILLNRIAGIEEIFEMLSEDRGLTMTEIYSTLKEKLKVDWRSTNQTMFRLNWLLSLGYVDLKVRKYFLSNKGKTFTKGEITEEKIAEPIDDYMKRVTELVRKHPQMSEANTIATLIEPLLEILGWNTRDLDEVQREYPIPGGKGTERADIALKIRGRPKVLIEAKPAGMDLEDHLAKQPINYAIMGNVDWCVLANGRELRVYNAYWKVEGIEQRLLFKLAINEYGEKRDKLWLLSKESIISGKLYEEMEREYARRKVSQWFRQNEDTIIKGIVKLDPALKEERVKATINEVLSIIRGTGDDCARQGGGVDGRTG